MFHSFDTGAWFLYLRGLKAIAASILELTCSQEDPDSLHEILVLWHWAGDSQLLKEVTREVLTFASVDFSFRPKALRG